MALVGFAGMVLISLFVQLFIVGEEIEILTFARAIAAGVGLGVGFYFIFPLRGAEGDSNHQ